MAVTHADVLRACAELDKAGKRPTYDNVRAIIGPCSYSALVSGIREYLKTSVAPPPLQEAPETIAAVAMKAASEIWTEALKTAQGRADERLAQLSTELQNVRATMSEISAGADAYVAKYEALAEADARKDRVIADKDNLIADLQHRLAAVEEESGAKDVALAKSRQEAATLRELITTFRLGPDVGPPSEAKPWTKSKPTETDVPPEASSEPAEMPQMDLSSLA